MLDRFPGRAFAAILWAIIVAAVCVLYGSLTGCTVIEKVFHKQTTKVDSVTRFRTDSLAYHQKVVKEGYGLSVRFDTGCTNRITFNPSTGLIEASGNVAGVSFSGQKEGKETDSVRVQKQQETILQKETKLVTKTVTKKVLPWWVYVVGGLAAIIAVYSLYNKLNPIKKFYPF
jgi:hypothetical protein